MNEKIVLLIWFVGNLNDGFFFGVFVFLILCCDVINFCGDFGIFLENNKKKIRVWIWL